MIVFCCLYHQNDNCREFFDKYVFRKEISSENLPCIDMGNLKNGYVSAYSKYIVILKENQLKLYNKYGKQEHVLKIEISNPIFESDDNYLCIAEKGGQKLYLISNRNVVWQKEVEGNISSINVNKNGYVSVVMSGVNNYKSVVQIFSVDGIELFKTYLGTSNVIDTDISNDNKYLAIAEANFSGVVVQSNIKIISIEDAKKNLPNSIRYTHIADTNKLIINVKYNNKNELICMYDDHIDILKEGQNTKLIDFEDEKLLFVDINISNKYIKVVQKDDNLANSEIYLEIINSNNQKVSSYKIEITPKTVNVQNNIIAVNLGTNILFIDSNGWLLKKYQSNKEVGNIVLGKNIAGIVCKKKIEVLSL